MNKTILIKCQAATTLPIDVLFDFQKSLKKITKNNLRRLKDNIIERGFIAPIFVWRDGADNKILDGHQRLKALTALQSDGWTIPPVPVAFIEADSEELARKALLSIASQYGEFELDELKDWLADMDEKDREFLRFSDGELKIKQAQEQAEEQGEEPTETESQTGDIWELGQHRVLCGDSTDMSCLTYLMAGKQCDLVFTDPPYGVAIGEKNQFLNQFQKSGRNLKPIENDNISCEELKEKLVQAFTNLKTVMADCCSVFVTAPQGGEIGLMMMMQESGLTVRHMIIWEKNSPTFSMGRLDYDYQHEPILYTWNKKHKFTGRGFQKTSIWKYDKPMKSKEHPTMKPVELVENAILNHTEEGELVVDIFLGSGTTLIAAEKNKRICYGIELDPHYCDVIVSRYRTWCKDNGRTPIIKLNGEEHE
jgi:DNA modification methylase